MYFIDPYDFSPIRNVSQMKKNDQHNLVRSLKLAGGPYVVIYGRKCRQKNRSQYMVHLPNSRSHSRINGCLPHSENVYDEIGFKPD